MIERLPDELLLLLKRRFTLAFKASRKTSKRYLLVIAGAANIKPVIDHFNKYLLTQQVYQRVRFMLSDIKRAVVFLVCLSPSQGAYSEPLASEFAAVPVLMLYL